MRIAARCWHDWLLKAVATVGAPPFKRDGFAVRGDAEFATEAFFHAVRLTMPQFAHPPTQWRAGYSTTDIHFRASHTSSLPRLSPGSSCGQTPSLIMIGQAIEIPCLGSLLRSPPQPLHFRNQRQATMQLSTENHLTTETPSHPHGFYYQVVSIALLSDISSIIDSIISTQTYQNSTRTKFGNCGAMGISNTI